MVATIERQHARAVGAEGHGIAQAGELGAAQRPARKRVEPDQTPGLALVLVGVERVDAAGDAHQTDLVAVHAR